MQKKLIGVIAGFLLLPMAHAESCATLVECLARYPTVATDEAGIDPEENALAERVRSFGPRAIPSLIELLQSPRKGVRSLAAYTLRDIDGLTPDHLPALMKSKENSGWLPPAIARIGTPEAVDFLIEVLRRDPETHNQVTFALRRLGAKAAPGVANLLKCSADCDEDVLHAAVFVLMEMKADAAGSLPLLLQIAGDDRLARSSRLSAIRGVGAIGESALRYVPEMIALKTQAPALASAIDLALADIGSSESVPALMEALPANPESVLERIAGLRGNGFAAGPAVMKYLADPRWNVRVEAARTLGSIGYLPAEAALRAALADQADWEFVYFSVLALGHMKASGSIDALKTTRDTHWYPPVRKLAAMAIAHIKSGSTLETRRSRIFDFIDGAPKSCTSVLEERLVESKDRKLYSRDDMAQLLELSVESVRRTYSCKEMKGKRHQIPRVALKVADGWLAGTDDGEWGGELIHMRANGPQYVIWQKNIQDIFLLGEQIVAISGLSHLGSNDGLILRIDNRNGDYVATPWKRLPGASDTTWLIAGGQILVNTHEAGSVIIDATGNIRMATCLSVSNEEQQ